ncbi:hypothetical protein [Bombilactobacillus thymidiniphilus]|uniref:Uncharacterized protein n=1 Tax=Bombilactobacillus thymidiniphilus TaxID=2923363 RepID=A0ABY4PCF0_9LACO|nr:hypothetical protein [Bombilactobacillus thymidiniphilus]UQS83191.1 hypothetical protein MOO47_05235 [Bombilactobacillus thymidiniphilus]
MVGLVILLVQPLTIKLISTFIYLGDFMSILTRIFIIDLDNVRVIYDVHAKKVLGYKKPEKTSVIFFYVFTVVIGIAIWFGGSSRRTIHYSAVTSPRIKPLKDQPYFWKILLIYLFLAILGTILFHIISEQQLERAGQVNYELNNEQISKALNKLDSEYKKSLGIKGRITSKIFNNNFKYKYILIFLVSYLILFIMLLMCVTTTILNKILSISPLLLFCSAAIIYGNIVSIFRYFAKKRLDTRVNKNRR